MDRPPFGKRARQRIWQETSVSAKGRAIPFIIGAVGIVLGFLINLFWLHLNTAKQLAILSAVSFGGSYVVWFIGAFMRNTLRVPWLLDAESNDLIKAQETRAENAEGQLAEIRAARDKHDLFGSLMQQGVQFSQQIRGCQSDAQFASWDRHFGDWNISVQRAMQDLGFPTDAVEFARAGEYATPVSGVISPGSNQEFRARVLKKHQENLADFVKRHFP